MTREEAIEHLKEWKECISSAYRRQVIDMAIEALSKPIVDITQRDLCADISCTDCPFMKETCKLMDYVAYADRPHGEWIDMHEDGHNYWVGTCNQCGKYSMEVGNFCPNCGARMTPYKGGDSE